MEIEDDLNIMHSYKEKKALNSCNIINHSKTLRPRQNGRHFQDDIFKWTFVNKNVLVSIKISLKLVPKAPNYQYSSFGSDNVLALVRRQAIIWAKSDG